jgi:hypothetical protein
MLSVVFADKRKGIIAGRAGSFGRRSADYDHGISASESSST